MKHNLNTTWQVWASLLPLLFCLHCNMPEAPKGETFSIYNGLLTPGFDIGVDDDQEMRNWLINEGDHFRLAYPAGLEGGSVFMVAGGVPLEQVTEDFSAFEAMVLDLRGGKGGECVQINISDPGTPHGTPQFVTDLSRDFEAYVLPLSGFGNVDVAQLHTVAGFSFSGACPVTVDVSSVQYVHRADAASTMVPYHVYTCNALAQNVDVGVASSPGPPMTIENRCGVFDITYPAGKEWGAVFYYLLDGLTQDVSTYSSLGVTLKGQPDQVVHLGLEDVDELQADTEILLSDTLWHTVDIPLNTFYPVALDKLVVVASFTFFGETAQTLKVRDVRFLP